MHHRERNILLDEQHPVTTTVWWTILNALAFAAVGLLSQREFQVFVVNFWDVEVEQNNAVETDFNSCDYGLVAEEAYNISLLNQEILQNKTTFTTVLDWVIGGETCEDAKRNSESYACKAEISACYNSTNGPPSSVPLQFLRF